MNANELKVKVTLDTAEFDAQIEEARAKIAEMIAEANVRIEATLNKLRELREITCASETDVIK